MASLLIGCATPFNQHLAHNKSSGPGNPELPVWVTDEWETVSDDRHNRPAHGRITAPADPESLNDLIVWALENNPSVQAAEARWAAMRNRIVQARTLPDPELSYRIIVEQVDTDRDPIGHAVGITQMFPWFGTLERAGEVKAAEARAAAQRYAQQQLTVAASIKRAWAEYAYLHAAVAVYREQLELLRQIEEVVRTLFRVGEIAQRDLVRVEAEVDRVENDRRDAEEMIVAAAARLNAAVGRASDAPLPIDPELPRQTVDIEASELLEQLARLNPTLEGLRHELAARRHAKQLAEKQFYPDFMLGIEYGANTSARMARNERRAGMAGSGSDMLVGMIGLRLPIWRDSYEAGVREAMAEWGATLRDLADTQYGMEADVKMTLYQINDSQRRMALFGERLRIRAEQVLESTLTAYRAGDASFTDLIEAQRELLEFTLAAERATADRFGQIARLDELVGRAIDGNGALARPRRTQENRP